MSYTHDQQPENSSDELFGEVISSYSDKEAVEDGVLVELYFCAMFQGLPINRMTGHLYEELLPFFEAEASLFNGDLSRAIASIFDTKCRLASGDPGNTDESGISTPFRRSCGWSETRLTAGPPCSPRTTKRELEKTSCSLFLCSETVEQRLPSPRLLRRVATTPSAQGPYR